MSEEYLKRIADALERRFPPPPPSGIHFFDPEVKERAISIRSTQGGNSVLEWTKSGDSPQTPIPGVNAITGHIYSVKWNLKPVRRGNEMVDVATLMVGVEVSSAERYVLRSGVTTNFGYQFLKKLDSLPKDVVANSKFRIVAAANDPTKVNPKTGMTYLETVFCRLYLENGEEVKADYNPEIKNDVDYLTGLADRLGSYFGASSTEGVAGEEEDHLADPSSVQPKPQLVKVSVPDKPSVDKQILAEYARLDLRADPDRGKNLIKQHFGDEATHASLTPEQKDEWLEILKQEKVKPPFKVSAPEETEELQPPQPAVIPVEEMDAGAYAKLVGEIKAKESLLGLAPAETKSLIENEFGKSMRNSLTEVEMVRYLEMLNQLEATK